MTPLLASAPLCWPRATNPRGKVSFRMEVVQFDPPRVFAVRGPNGATERYELDETPDGTVVRAITGTPLDWRGVLNYWTLRAWSRKHPRSDLQRLKTEVEGSCGPSAAAPGPPEPTP